MTKARQPGLDRIRGVAILLVLVLHYWVHPFGSFSGSGPLVGTADGLLALSWSGVDLFFVLSGFLLGGTLMDRRESESYFGTFYVRRILRIVPLYVLIVASWLIISHGADAWMYLTFTQNFVWGLTGDHSPVWTSATWSLAVEEQFYLVLPLLVFLVRPARLPLVLGALILTAPVARMIVVWGFNLGIPAAYQLMPCRMDSLFLGVLAAWALREPRIREVALAHRGLLRLLLGIGAMGLLVAAALRWDNGMPQIWVLGYTYIAGFYALVIYASAIWPSKTKAGPLAWIGERSYSMYLLHMPAFLIAGYWIGHGIMQSVIALGATLIMAWALYYFVEDPILSFSHKRFRYRSRPDMTALTAVDARPG